MDNYANTKNLIKIFVVSENELLRSDIKRRLAQTEYSAIFSARTDNLIPSIIHEQPAIVIIDQLNELDNNPHLANAIFNNSKINTRIFLVVPRSSELLDYRSELPPSTMVITFPFGRLELEQFIERALTGRVREER